MSDQAIRSAITAVCDDDGMDAAYQRALAALIENAMRNNLDTSDIATVLNMIPTTDSSDED